MIARLFVFFLLAAVSPAQQTSTANPPKSEADSAGPVLPVIDPNACPFEGCTFGKWKVTKESAMYSTWQGGRTEAGKLHPGEEVVALTGVHITLKPDRISVRKPIPDLEVEPGDVILRYMYVGEGFANIWAKGHWHKEHDCSFVTEKDGMGCMKNCSAVVAECGAKEWWVQVKTSGGVLGWVLVQDNFAGMDSLASLNSSRHVLLSR